MLILNGKILSMEGETIEHGYVQTKGKVIKELGSMEQGPSPGKGEEVLDVKGAWVTVEVTLTMISSSFSILGSGTFSTPTSFTP